MNLLFPNKTYDPVSYAEREMKSNLATGDPVICRTHFIIPGVKNQKRVGEGEGG